MMSQSSNDDLFPMAQTRNKRDEFLVEIRKKKNQTVIEKKRTKFYRSESNPSDDSRLGTVQDGNMYFEDNQSQLSREITEETKMKLNEARNQFFAVVERQEWKELIDMLIFLREAIGDNAERLPASVILDMGIVPHLITLLSEEYCMYPDVQTEISWLFANISAGTTQETEFLIKEGIIPVAFKCLTNISNEDLHENIMWILANIAGESNFVFRDLILNTDDFLEHLAKEHCRTQKKSGYYRTSAWLISNLVRGLPFPDFEKIAPCFKTINLLLSYQDSRIELNCLTSIASLSEEGREDNLEALYNASLLNKVAQYLTNKDEKVAQMAMKAAGNLIRCGRVHKETKALESSVLKALPYALTHQYLHLKQEACITLSSLYSRSFEDHNVLSTSELVPLLMQIVENQEEELKSLATFSLFKIYESNSDNKLSNYVNDQVLNIFMRNLASNHNKLLDNTLLTLNKILWFGENLKSKNQGYNGCAVQIMQNGSIYLLERLANHPDDVIRAKAVEILDRFFQKDGC